MWFIVDVFSCLFYYFLVVIIVVVILFIEFFSNKGEGSGWGVGVVLGFGSDYW